MAARVRTWAGGVAKRIAQLGGFELARYHPPGRQRSRLLRAHDIALVLDVGANRGQYAQELRRFGYAGRIISLEPAAGPFAALRQRAAHDPDWEVRQLAAADREGTLRLAEADNFSSLLPATGRLTGLFAQAAPRRREPARAIRLDALDLDLPAGRRTLLKLDIQGYEREALEGASGIMPAIELVAAELSLVELYEGQALMDELMAQLAASGFELCGLHPILRDRRTGELLQFDGMFRRRRPTPALRPPRPSAPPGPG